MKINVNKKDLNLVNKLLEVKQINMAFADCYNTYLANPFFDADTKDIDEHTFYCMLMEHIGIDLNKQEDNKLAKEYAINGIKQLDIKDYISNPYYQNIKTMEVKNKRWELKYHTYKPYSGFVYDDVTVDENDFYKETYNIGYFKTKFSYLAVDENQYNWMSVTPNEINTMKKPINEAKGKVLVFGLGLGYFAYMVARKKDVSEVVVIESDINVIELFKNNLLPQMECSNKIKIINEDAFDYLEKMDKNYFNFAFIDIYHDANDGLTSYLRFKKSEKQFSNVKFTYWLEKSLIVMIRRCILTIVEENLNGYDDENYKIANDEIDKVINKLYFMLKDYAINNFEDLNNLLSTSSILSLIK